jgi:hypothetical protein
MHVSVARLWTVGPGRAAAVDGGRERSVRCATLPHPRGLRPRASLMIADDFLQDCGKLCRGRDRPCGRPPAQIPACGITALGSYLGWLAAKRASGNGCVMRVGGSHRVTMRFILPQVSAVFWLRRRSA